jgi:hypothetical protein
VLLIEVTSFGLSALMWPFEEVAHIRLDGSARSEEEAMAAQVHELTHAHFRSKNRFLDEGVALYVEQRSVSRVPAFLAGEDLERPRADASRLASLLAYASDDPYLENIAADETGRRSAYVQAFQLARFLIEQRGLALLEELRQSLAGAAESAHSSLVARAVGCALGDLDAVVCHSAPERTAPLSLARARQIVLQMRREFTSAPFAVSYPAAAARAHATEDAEHADFALMAIKMISRKCIVDHEQQTGADNRGLVRDGEVFFSILRGAKGVTQLDYAEGALAMAKLVTVKSGIEKAVIARKVRAAFDRARRAGDYHAELLLDMAAVEVFTPAEYGRNIELARELMLEAERDAAYRDEVELLRRECAARLAREAETTAGQ